MAETCPSLYLGCIAEMGAMAYSDFTLGRVRKELALTIVDRPHLFAGIKAAPPSAFLTQSLGRYTNLASLIGTEKAKSEFLIAPILAEVRDQVGNQIGLFSGTEFSVDPEKGLQGFCDFILSRSPEQLDVTAPVVTVVEAKNDNLKSGLGQCIAEMVAAQIFNDREGRPIEVIYGAVTSGTNWRFLRLQGQTIEIDETEYFLNQVEQILGVLLIPFGDLAIGGGGPLAPNPGGAEP
jgi:hypothetical protein